MLVTLLSENLTTNVPLVSPSVSTGLSKSQIISLLSMVCWNYCHSSFIYCNNLYSFLANQCCFTMFGIISFVANYLFVLGQIVPFLRHPFFLVTLALRLEKLRIFIASLGDPHLRRLSPWWSTDTMQPAKSLFLISILYSFYSTLYTTSIYS